jgi:hypothetical protein
MSITRIRLYTLATETLGAVVLEEYPWEQSLLFLGTVKSKGVSLRHEGAKGAPTHSWRRQYMGGGWVVSVTPRPRFTPWEGPRYALDVRLGGPPSWSGHKAREKNPFACPWDLTSVQQSVVRHYIDWATPAP